MYYYKLTLCYDGTRYKGWQRQGNTDNTIQARVEECLSAILGEATELAASGRTDAGVHANAQVCSFSCKNVLDCESVLTRLRHELPEDIGAISLERASDRFHARLNCKEKTYVYRVWNSDAPNVFERRYMYRFPGKLDVEAMRWAASLLEGEHDFSAFCSNRNMKKSAVRNVKSIKIEQIGDELRFTLTGNGFLYNTVRIIVGTLLEVGTHARSAEEIPQIISSCKRENAGATAPAKGLILWEVRY